MKKIAVGITAFAALFFGVIAVQAQMMGGMMEYGKGMMEEHMPGMMGTEFTTLCRTDFGDLDLTSEVLKSLEDKRFEAHKMAIRTGADLKILRLEIARMIESRNFDLNAVEQKATEIAQKETELRKAHLGLLHDIAAALTDDQWQKLRQRNRKMISDGMMPMMGEMMGQGMAPCMTGGMMQGGGMMPMMKGMTGQGMAPAMTGGMMQGGMMMNQGSMEGAGENNAHHPGNSEEAEKFFKDEK